MINLDVLSKLEKATEIASVVGTGVVLLRDYVRYRRQKAIVDNFARLISLIPLKEKGGVLEEQSNN